MIPLGRHTTPEEIARAVLYLASDASAMITASTFAIDGGMTADRPRSARPVATASGRPAGPGSQVD